MLSLIIVMNLLTFCSFNSTGIRRPASQDFIKKLLLDYHVDIMLLQETWLLDSQLHVLSDLSSDYMHTGKSGVDSAVMLVFCMDDLRVVQLYCGIKICLTKLYRLKLTTDVSLLLNYL